MPTHPITDRHDDEGERSREAVLQALREIPKAGAPLSRILYCMQQHYTWNRLALILTTAHVRRLLAQFVDEGLVEELEPDAYRLRATPPSSGDETST